MACVGFEQVGPGPYEIGRKGMQKKGMKALS